MRLQLGHRVQSGRQQFCAPGGQMPVPDIERREVDRPSHGIVVIAADGRACPTPPGNSRGLEQRRPLLEYPVVVTDQARQPRAALYEQVIEEQPSLARVAAHDRQILRREQDRPQRPEDVSRPRGRAPLSRARLALPA